MLPACFRSKISAHCRRQHTPNTATLCPVQHRNPPIAAEQHQSASAGDAVAVTGAEEHQEHRPEPSSSSCATSKGKRANTRTICSRFAIDGRAHSAWHAYQPAEPFTYLHSRRRNRQDRYHMRACAQCCWTSRGISGLAGTAAIGDKVQNVAYKTQFRQRNGRWIVCARRRFSEIDQPLQTRVPADKREIVASHLCTSEAGTAVEAHQRVRETSHRHHEDITPGKIPLRDR